MKPTNGTKSNPSTIAWSESLVERRFLKVPKIMFFLGRYEDRVGKEIQPRHLMLILALAAKKFGVEPVRAFWGELASMLGVKPDTVRKWAYELRDLNLLKIERKREPRDENRPGIRNDRNAFDYSAFTELLEAAQSRWENRQIEYGDE
jgi:hypothetical protein